MRPDGLVSPYATWPAPMYYGSGYIGRGDFWKFGLIPGVINFAGLLLIVMPWLWVGVIERLGTFTSKSSLIGARQSMSAMLQ